MAEISLMIGIAVLSGKMAYVTIAKMKEILMATTAHTLLSYPNARPLRIVVAGPPLVDSITSTTGLPAFATGFQGWHHEGR